MCNLCCGLFDDCCVPCAGRGKLVVICLMRVVNWLACVGCNLVPVVWCVLRGVCC